jgi:hypothetical protein
MAEQPQNLPAVIQAPGVNPNDGHEHFWSPRNIIAFAVVAAMIASIFVPYFVDIPDGRNGDLVFSGAEKLLTIAMLILAYFFGTTVGSSRKDATIQTQAAAAAAPQASAAPDNSLKVEPPFTLRAEEPTDGPEADASRQPAESPGVPAPAGVLARDGGPPE